MTDFPERIRRALGDRYALEGEIGQGGMATVFRARDLKHDRVVAIKLLRPEIAAHVDKRRFLREIGIAARLAHPHILPLHDSGIAEDLIYYVTPFVDGASLEQRLRCGEKLSLLQALRLAAEVADALAYAHAHGVVHRDVKPGNILLEDEHAVVCDFGIATASWSGQVDLTATGVAIGTPLYMSPEQVIPGPDVDGRADVYALGCILFEMLAGEPPFLGPPRLLMARKSMLPPPRLEERSAEVPEDVSDLIVRMISPDPVSRPDSRECVTTLATLAARSMVPSPVAAGRHVVRRLATHIRSPLGVGAVACAAAAGLFALLQPDDPSDALLTRGRVVVGLVRNETGDPALSAVGNMVVDWITQGLQMARISDVVPTPTALAASQFVEASGGQDPLRMLAEETGSGIVVSGRYYVIRDSVYFNMQITDLLGSHSFLPLDTEAGLVADPGDVISRLRRRVIGAMAVAMDQRVSEALGADALPPTFSAYREFTEGLELYARNEPRSAGPHFERAYEEDTTLTSALLFLAINESNLGEWARADSILKFLELRRSELTRHDRHWLDYRRSIIAGDRVGALRAIRQAALLAPSSKAPYNLAVEAFENGRPTEALEALSLLEPERGMMRGWLPYWWIMADAHHWLGQLAEERETARRAAQLYPDRLVPLFLQARVAAVAGDTTTVLRLLRSADRLREEERGASVGGAYVDLAEELHAHGHPASARRVFEATLDWYNSLASDRATDADSRWHYARALYATGGLNAAAREVELLLTHDPDRVDFLGLLGLINASSGKESELRTIWQRLEEIGGQPYQFGLPQVYQSRIAALRGDPDSATAKLREAFERGRHLGHWVHITREYNGLRDHDTFIELTSPRDSPTTPLSTERPGGF